MELASEFDEFLRETVNLDQDRVSSLETSIGAIETFLENSSWSPSIRGFHSQGSWAHGTIIKPVDKGEFDADLLAEVEPVDGWTARDYINELKAAFKKSSRYKLKVRAYSHCVTITYAKEKKIDVAPLIADRQYKGQLEVCNRTADEFEPSEPMQYTEWLVQQNALSGRNSFRKVTRLLKYLRDIKIRFVCPSVLLTTLLANTIYESDKNSMSFGSVPRTLQSLVGRLDDWLQLHRNKPIVPNPFLATEDFAAAWTDAQYESFRTSIHRYRGWIDDAIRATSKEDSVIAWRKLFGEEFAPNVVLKSAVSEGRFALAHPFEDQRGLSGRLIDAIKVFGRAAIPKTYLHLPHMQDPTWREADDEEVEVIVTATVGGGAQHMKSRSIASGQLVNAGPSIYLEAMTPSGAALSTNYKVEWRITNAPGSPWPRGGFYPGNSTHQRVETLSYRGVHIAEAFVLRARDGALVGASDPFFVAIE